MFYNCLGYDVCLTGSQEVAFPKHTKLQYTSFSNKFGWLLSDNNTVVDVYTKQVTLPSVDSFLHIKEGSQVIIPEELTQHIKTIRPDLLLFSLKNPKIIKKKTVKKVSVIEKVICDGLKVVTSCI
jgi:hypothetical protein